MREGVEREKESEKREKDEQIKREVKKRYREKESTYLLLADNGSAGSFLIRLRFPLSPPIFPSLLSSPQHFIFFLVFLDKPLFQAKERNESRTANTPPI